MITQANARRIPLADRSVHCIATSPPYYGLRFYDAGPGEIGQEQTPAEYVEAMREFGREAWRVLRDDGTLWLNLGDSFGHGTNASRQKSRTSNKISGGQHQAQGSRHGGQAKQLLGIPWRVAFALQDDGWILRSEIVWEKPNCMPESVTDRPTKAHETIFLLTKQPRYFYDAEAIREPQVIQSLEEAKSRAGNIGAQYDKWEDKGGYRGNGALHRDAKSYDPAGRNRRSVWSIATQPYHGAHFACWPPALVEPMIKAGTSERGVCPVCGAPWGRVIKKVKGQPASYKGSRFDNGKTKAAAEQAGAVVGESERTTATVTTGWQPTCQHNAAPIPAVVLDPFVGSGTTGAVSRELGRRFVGLDLSAKYLGLLALPRVERKQVEAALNDLPLFAKVADD